MTMLKTQLKTRLLASVCWPAAWALFAASASCSGSFEETTSCETCTDGGTSPEDDDIVPEDDDHDGGPEDEDVDPDAPDSDPPPDDSGCLDGAGDYVNEGPYGSTTMPGPSGFTVFLPATLDDDCLHPIAAWGNGTGVNGPSIYAHLNSHVASWGVVVIASHDANVGSGTFHRDGLDWLLAQNEEPSSPLFGRLSPRAGVAGHSQGGIGASAAVSHPNVEAEVNVQGGGSSQDRAALLLTGTDDFMSGSIHNSYNAADGPAFLASYTGADHISTPTMLGASSPGGIQYKRLYAAWLRCFLADDTNACALFEGGDACGICSDPGWAELTSKSMP
jgi:hypothetical protein